MKSFAVAVLSLAFISANAQANLLDDGSFDLATGDSQTSNSAWSLNANFPNANAPGDASAQFQNAPWASNDTGAIETGIWFRSFTGAAGGPLAQADISQSVNAPADGTYVLQFDARRETNFSAASWSVDLGSSSYDLLSNVPADGAWYTYQVALNGVTAGDSLSVVAAMVDGQDAMANPQSAFLDNFDLQAVPEPTSLMLVGMGVAGMFLRRRRR